MKPDKLLLVAATELTMAVRSKAFVIGMTMVPVMIAAVIGFARVSRTQTDREDRHFAVVDETGALYRGLAATAEQWNRGRERGAGAPAGPRMFPEPATQGALAATARRALAERVRKKQLKAFVEIPAGAIDGYERVRYFSDAATDITLPRWIEATINREILSERFRRASVDPGEVARLTQQAPMLTLGVPVWDAQGVMQEPERVDQIRTQAVPIGIMMLLLFVVIASAPWATP